MIGGPNHEPVSCGISRSGKPGRPGNRNSFPEHSGRPGALRCARNREIGITGAAAAIANAVYHATGKRVQELPITLDKLL
jgi:hypothetical protein